MTTFEGHPPCFTVEFPLRWGDMDQLGHVNNTVYFRAFEQARTAWIDSIPMELDNNPAYVVIVHTECTFLKELKAPGVAKIEIYPGTMGTSSLVQQYRLTRVESPSETLAYGSAKLVWLNADTGRSTPIPQRFQEALDRKP